MKTLASGALALAFLLSPALLPAAAGADVSQGGGDPPGGRPPVERPPCCSANGIICTFGSAAGCKVWCEPCACSGATCILGFPLAATCQCI
jgi:hypothetical protein